MQHQFRTPRVVGTPINELYPPYKPSLKLLEESNSRMVRPAGIYDAVIADGGVTKNGRRFSRKDFVNAQRLYFSNQINLEKTQDPLSVTLADEFYPDGSLRLDRTIGIVNDMKVIDKDNSWYVTIRFSILDISTRQNPWYQTVQPLLMKLHGIVKAIPCGILPNGTSTVDHVGSEGVDYITGFLLRSIMLSCNSGFEKADAIQPVYTDQNSRFMGMGATVRPPTPTRPMTRQGTIFDRRPS